MKQLSQFLREVKLELSRVEWPSFNEFLGSVIVAFIVIILSSLFLGVVDKLISVLAKYVFIYSS